MEVLFYLICYHTKLRHYSNVLNATWLRHAVHRTWNSEDNVATQRGLFVKTVCRYLLSGLDEQ
jgi:hypothetical protein